MHRFSSIIRTCLQFAHRYTFLEASSRRMIMELSARNQFSGTVTRVIKAIEELLKD